MEYPIKINKDKRIVSRDEFRIGKWYECVESRSLSFTVNCAYLCVRDDSGLSLVCDDYKLKLVSPMHSKFIEYNPKS